MCGRVANIANKGYTPSMANFLTARNQRATRLASIIMTKGQFTHEQALLMACDILQKNDEKIANMRKVLAGASEHTVAEATELVLDGYAPLIVQVHRTRLRQVEQVTNFLKQVGAEEVQVKVDVTISRLFGKQAQNVTVMAVCSARTVADIQENTLSILRP